MDNGSFFKHKIGSGNDSKVFLVESDEGPVVLKVYDGIKYLDIVSWYADLTTSLSNPNFIEIGQLLIEGKVVNVKFSVVPHTEIADDDNCVLQAPYIKGPKLSAFSFTYEEFNVDGLDEDEAKRLTNFRESLSTNTLLLNQLFDIYFLVLSEKLASLLPLKISGGHTLPGGINIKVRMPNDGEILFYITDLFGNIYEKYLRYIS